MELLSRYLFVGASASTPPKLLGHVGVDADAPIRPVTR